MKTMKTMISVLAISAVAGIANAGDFSTIDANANGQIEFKEYKAFAVEDGKSSTLAAQEFVAMSQGDATVTEDEFLIASASVTHSSDTTTDIIAQPMPVESFETEMSVDAPLQEAAAKEFDDVSQGEAEIESEIEAEDNLETDMSLEDMNAVDKSDMSLDENSSESMTSTSEIKTKSEVAGEIATSEDWSESQTTEMEAETDVDLNVTTETEVEDDIEVPQAPDLPDLEIID